MSRLESRRMPTASTVERRKPWEEHNIVVAFVLAVLVPGLGHLYQGRTLKGLIYLFGILGLFFWGVRLGDGIVVYNVPDKGASRRITLHYAAQLGAGAVSYPALWQTRRMVKGNNNVRQIDRPFTAKFSGRLIDSDHDAKSGKLEGTVHLEPAKGEYGMETKGTFTGTLDGKPAELQLSSSPFFDLERPIAAGSRRTLKCSVVDQSETRTGSGKRIVGSIPRPFFDSYGVPPDQDQLQEVTGRLGKLHELALVFTWIAGLLNVLAIWDCVQGPAYGFGDEVWATPKPDENAATTNPLANVSTDKVPTSV
jgi:hypothetical protein